MCPRLGGSISPASGGASPPPRGEYLPRLGGSISPASGGAPPPPRGEWLPRLERRRNAKGDTISPAPQGGTGDTIRLIQGFRPLRCRVCGCGKVQTCNDAGDVAAPCWDVYLLWEIAYNSLIIRIPCAGIVNFRAFSSCRYHFFMMLLSTRTEEINLSVDVYTSTFHRCEDRPL